MMSRSIRLFVMVAAILAGIAAAGLVAAEDRGPALFSEVCSPCHSAGTRPLDNVRQTRDQWKETVEKMMDLGAEVPKKRVPELLDYLVRTHGPSEAGKSGGGEKSPSTAPAK